MSTRVNFSTEFDAENWAEGDAVFLTLSIPLSITGPAAVASK